MKNDFKKMEDEMDCLAANMAVLTDFSASISSTLQGQHEQITKLSGGAAQRFLRVLAGLAWRCGRSHSCRHAAATLSLPALEGRAVCTGRAPWPDVLPSPLPPRQESTPSCASCSSSLSCLPG